MFPRGAPGLALLLLRLFVGAELLTHAVTAVPAFNVAMVWVLGACALALVIGIALALLGPGAYSLDARVFGRRLMEFGPDIGDDK